MKNFTTPSLLLAGLMALAGVANAQTAGGTSNVPSKAGEASTMTNGVPNAKTTNTMGSEAPAMTTGQVRQNAMGRDAATTSTAAGTSNVPSKAGEASTMTNGVPNAKTTNTMGSEAPAMTKSQIRQDAKGRDAATATTNSPGRAGEASTMVQGRPNANPDAPTLTKSKSERRMEKEMKKAQRKQDREMAAMGHRGAHPAVGTSPNTSAGSPSVFNGGTPK